MKGILGKKIGMTEVFTKDGKLIPVTVVSCEPNTVMQVKTTATDGYEAIQLGITDKKEKRATKAEIGHAKKAGVLPKRFLKEIRVSNASEYELGSTIKADIFEVGEKVDVTGTTKGHGYTGVIVRNNQSEGPKTHGSRYHRRPGSMGTMRPMRVMKGKTLSGHMGVDTVTVQNLTSVDVNVEENYILVSGNVPGAKESLVLIRTAVKGGNKGVFELVNYEPETVEEVTTEEVVETAETETTEETIANEVSAEEVKPKENAETPAEEEK